MLEAVVHCFASLFTDRAIRYRVDNGFDHFKVFNSVGVMKMVRSDIASSGVLFTLDTETGFEDVVFLTGAYGLGENVVQGAVDPDEFYVFKPTYRQGKKSVLKRELGAKKIKMVFSEGGLATTRNMPTDHKEREKFCLSDEEVLTLAGQAIVIEEHYSARAGQKRPMDVEWAKDGLDGRLYIVQARPETVASRRDRNALETYRIERRTPVRIEGRAVGTRIAVGRARVIGHLSELSQFVPGEILVADFDLARLGHGDEIGRGRRHQSRRPHLPCGDRRARARHSRDRRRRRGDARDPHRRAHFRLLRRGRRRPRL